MKRILFTFAFIIYSIMINAQNYYQIGFGLNKSYTDFTKSEIRPSISIDGRNEINKYFSFTEGIEYYFFEGSKNEYMFSSKLFQTRIGGNINILYLENPELSFYINGGISYNMISNMKLYTKSNNIQKHSNCFGNYLGCGIRFNIMEDCYTIIELKYNQLNSDYLDAINPEGSYHNDKFLVLSIKLEIPVYN
jgi:hypothetical protein